MSMITKAYREKEGFRLFLKLLMIFLISRLFMLIMMIVYNKTKGVDYSISFLMNEWDAKWYARMTEKGYMFPTDYNPQASWAFFPMYVLTCRCLYLICGGLISADWVGIIVSNVCIFIAAYTAVKYVRDLKTSKLKAEVDGRKKESLASLADQGKEHEGPSGDGNRSLLIGLLMFMAPYTFYCAAMYTEAMFIMFIALFFRACQKRKYLLAGLFSALASASRIVGCTLVFALLVELYLDYEERAQVQTLAKKVLGFVLDTIEQPKRVLGLMLCPLGTFSYMLYLYFFCGDPWAFMHVQIAWREEHYFPILGVLYKACTGQIENRYTYMGWFCIAMFGIYIYMIVRKHYSMGIFGIIALLIPLTSHVMSTCRFTVGSYVVFVGLYDLLDRMKGKWLWLKYLILAGFFVAEAFALYIWYNSDCWLM